MLFRKNKTPPARTMRRSPTTEQRSPAAFSYYAQRSDKTGTDGRREAGRPNEAASPRVGQLLAQRFGLFILLGVVVAGLVSSLSLSANPRIIAVSGSQNHYFLHNTATYQEAAAAILSSSIWNHNKITISPSAVGRQLQGRFPELASVSVTLPLLGHRPIIYIQPEQPALVVSSTSSGSYVVDQHGKALLATTQLPPSAALDLPVVTDQTGLTIRSGSQILTTDGVAFIVSVVQQVKAHNIAISSLILPSGTSELDMHLAGQPYYVKFNMHASLAGARQQAGTFIAVKNRLESQGITPGQYIDVRVDGRAYYQ
ncbi:MAG TPA: hypothetical protein VFI84_01895 [Candidatus Saccharimonadales bacterium]|nr:hypothetical protein [Candidatus Saccharimonadales bacterium]